MDWKLSEDTYMYKRQVRGIAMGTQNLQRHLHKTLIKIQNVKPNKTTSGAENIGSSVCSEMNGIG